MELSIDPVGGAWFTGIVAALLLLAPWLLPPRAVGLSASRRRVLQLLRTLASLALLFAFVRPQIVQTKSESLRPTLLMLIDGSRSMTIADALDGATRWDATRRLLYASSSALLRLGDSHDVRTLLFGRTIEPVTLEGGRLGLPAVPTGDETALGAALSDALAASRGEAGGALSGVILISDGAQRARPPRDASPVAAVGRLTAEGAPVYAVPVGQRATGDRPDVAIDDLVVSDAAFAGAPLDVAAVLRVGGFPNRSVRVRLLWEDADGKMEPVDAAAIVVRQGVPAYPVRLRHAPPSPGEWKLSVVADTLEGETLADNNEASTFVTVRDGGVRVLYLAGTTRTGGAPSIEQRFVRASLAASPDIAVERIVLNYTQPQRDLTRRLQPGSVEVVILDNVDKEGLSSASWRALSQLIESGAGLLMLGGRQSFGPGGHRDTLGNVLPITLGRAERQMLDAPVRSELHLPGPLRIVPSPGRRGQHPIVQLTTEDGDAVWADLPPLDGANRLGDNLKPSAQVIATTDDRRQPQPLLVIGQAGLGRSLAVAVDSTWRWVLAGRGNVHRQFWRQAVLWLAKKDEDPSSSVYLDLSARRVPAGSRLDIAAGVRLPADADPSADNGSTIRYETAVTRPDGATTELPLPGGGIRTTGVYVETAMPGDYRVKITAYRGTEALGEAESRFLVPRRDLELERPGAEPDTLARLAKATESDGGRTLALEELPALLNELAAKPPEKRREVVARTTLYDKWPVLLIFAGLMTAEWLVRRKAGMP